MWVKEFLKRIVFRLRAESTTDELIKRGLKVGENFQRNEGVIIDPSHCWLIEIGNNVILAPRVHLLAHDASTCNSLGYAKIGRINIGDNVFIGASSIILPNVSIGCNSIIGANSTVSKDVPANVVVAGSPAKIISSIEDFIAKNKELMDKSPVYEEDYTLRQNISEEKKKQQYEDLKNKIGFVK